MEGQYWSFASASGDNHSIVRTRERGDLEASQSAVLLTALLAGLSEVNARLLPLGKAPSAPGKVGEGR